MSNAISLDLRGLLWKHLLIIEKKEIINQFLKILNDPSIDEYRFVKTNANSWTITNAMTLPLKTNRMVL